MGIDTTFQPKTPTFAVDGSAAVAIDGRQDGVTSWRIRVVTATGTPAPGASSYVRWANGNAAAPSIATAPVQGVPSVNTLGINVGQTLYIEGIGAWLQFIGSGAFGATTFLEITGGQGGCGG